MDSDGNIELGMKVLTRQTLVMGALELAGHREDEIEMKVKLDLGAGLLMKQRRDNNWVVLFHQIAHVER